MVEVDVRLWPDRSAGGIAEVIAFLASGASRWINGRNIRVTNGLA
jgi:NAD(P)-dependent dehydrogenase (short-subunit alcohol dehydrogenase family)